MQELCVNFDVTVPYALVTAHLNRDIKIYVYVFVNKMKEARHCAYGLHRQTTNAENLCNKIYRVLKVSAVVSKFGLPCAFLGKSDYYRLFFYRNIFYLRKRMSVLYTPKSIAF